MAAIAWRKSISLRAGGSFTLKRRNESDSLNGLKCLAEAEKLGIIAATHFAQGRWAR